MHRSIAPSIFTSIALGRLARLAALALAIAIIFSLSVFAQPAYADRCQPEELVTGGGTSPIPESASPVCLVTDELVYPLVGCDSVPTPLRTCVDQISKNPDGTATIVVQRAPDTPQYLLTIAQEAPGTTTRLLYFGLQTADPIGTYEGVTGTPFPCKYCELPL